MASTRLFVPAISPELSFISRNWSIVEEISVGKNDEPIREIADAVIDRGCADADVLLRRLEEAISDGLAGVLRIDWVNARRSRSWASRARLFMPKGRTRIGTAGIWLGYDATALCLFGWIWPRYGGLDGRRELVRICRPRIPITCLPYEHPKKYPGLTEDDGVLWLDERLTARTRLDELTASVSTQARVFFRVSRPTLKMLAQT
jgi:hypothetical protein